MKASQLNPTRLSRLIFTMFCLPECAWGHQKVTRLRGSRAFSRRGPFFTWPCCNWIGPPDRPVLWLTGPGWHTGNTDLLGILAFPVSRICNTPRPWSMYSSDTPKLKTIYSLHPQAKIFQSHSAFLFNPLTCGDFSQNGPFQLSLPKLVSQYYISKVQ